MYSLMKTVTSNSPNYDFSGKRISMYVAAHLHGITKKYVRAKSFFFKFGSLNLNFLFNSARFFFLFILVVPEEDPKAARHSSHQGYRGTDQLLVIFHQLMIKKDKGCENANNQQYRQHCSQGNLGPVAKPPLHSKHPFRSKGWL